MRLGEGVQSWDEKRRPGRAGWSNRKFGGVLVYEAPPRSRNDCYRLFTFLLASGKASGRSMPGHCDSTTFWYVFFASSFWPSFS
jgi:hypothetical protein